MKKVLIISLSLILLCGCSISLEVNTDDLKDSIKDNFEKILETSHGISSSTRDYIQNEYYKNIVNLGDKAVPALIEMYDNGEFTKNGLDANIIVMLIQEITDCNIREKYSLTYSTPEEFMNLWKEYNCGFYPYKDEVSLMIKEKTLTKKGATFLLKNNTDKDYAFGMEYIIESKEGNRWEELETITGAPLTWNEIAYILKAHEEREITIDWSDGYGELKIGDYRLVKTTFKEDDRPIKEENKLHLYAEFSIK